MLPRPEQRNRTRHGGGPFGPRELHATAMVGPADDAPAGMITASHIRKRRLRKSELIADLDNQYASRRQSVFRAGDDAPKFKDSAGLWSDRIKNRAGFNESGFGLVGLCRDVGDEFRSGPLI